jgi:hypothetical protein
MVPAFLTPPFLLEELPRRYGLLIVAGPSSESEPSAAALPIWPSNRCQFDLSAKVSRFGLLSSARVRVRAFAHNPETAFWISMKRSAGIRELRNFDLPAEARRFPFRNSHQRRSVASE